MKPAPSSAQALWLLLWVRLARLRNQLSLIYNRPIGGGKSRKATRPKRRSDGAVTVFVVLLMMFGFGVTAHQGILNLQCALAGGDLNQLGSMTCLGPQPWRSEGSADGASMNPLQQLGLSVEFGLLFIVSLVAPLGLRELSQTEWDLEWLWTLPISRPVLLWGRLLQRIVSNSLGWMSLLPACTCLAWQTGHGWWSVPAGFVATLALLSLSALVHCLVEIGMRLAMKPAQLRNLQAVCSISALPLLYLAISAGTRAGATYLIPVIRHVDTWALWTPPGLVVQLLGVTSGVGVLSPALTLVAGILVAVFVGMNLLGYQLRHGLVASGERESGGRLPRPRKTLVTGTAFSGISAVQRRELRLLGRDRNFLVQSLFMPIIVVGSQLLLNGRLSLLVEAGGDPRISASVAFGLGAYVLMLSAFQTLNTEGNALWLLYTFPCSIESVLKDKARLWGVIAVVYALVVILVSIHFGHGFRSEYWILLPLVLVGLPLYSLIATSLGVFAFNPQSQEARTRVRPTYAYLFMLLTSFYVYTLYASQWWQKLVVIVLSAAVAFALWQKARDQLPYILDPDASPKATVSSSDGLIVAMLFFFLQGLSILFLSRQPRHPSAVQLTEAYIIAGAVSYGLTRFIYWRSGTRNVPKLLGARATTVLGHGVAGGLLAATLGLGYLAIIRNQHLTDGAREIMHGTNAGLWLLGLAVLAAPVFEEFIFRGLLFGGLRRSMGVRQAMLASAAVFAIVHPPLSMLPVFVLGLCAALAYEGTGSLLAPMITHALYNAVVVGAQLHGQV